jgi:hypothetical protein
MYAEYEDRVLPFFLLSTCRSVSYKHEQGTFLSKFNAVISSVPKPNAAVPYAKISLHAAIHKSYYTDGLMYLSLI